MQQNLRNRPPVNPKYLRRLTLAQPLMMARKPNSSIQIHSVHPQASSQHQLASETKKAGVLLRRYSETTPPFLWIIFAPALSAWTFRTGAAADLGIGFSMLSKWIQKSRPDDLPPAADIDFVKEN